MQYKIITSVETEPVTLDEAKAHLRLLAGETDEDDLIETLIMAAREYAEKFTRRALASQTIELYLDEFPDCDQIDLPRPPLQSVTSVVYKDAEGTETTLAANTDYITDTDSLIGRVVRQSGKSWPSIKPYPVSPIKIRYIAGYTSENPIPEIIKRAMLMLIGHWFLNREAVFTGSITKEIEFAVKALLSYYVVRWFE